MEELPRADALVLFGATGDLSRKKLFPALYHLALRERAAIALLNSAAQREVLRCQVAVFRVGSQQLQREGRREHRGNCAPLPPPRRQRQARRPWVELLCHSHA